MFVLTSKIQVGKFVFESINDVSITEDFDKIGTTATLLMPNSGRFRNVDGTYTNVETSATFKVGDAVKIELGYNGALRTEFTGYVKNIKIGTPLSIECEDDIFVLKRKNLKKAFRKTTLKSILEHILSGTGIGLSENIPTIQFDTFYFKDTTAANALEKLKDEYGLTISILPSKKLYVGLYSPVDNTVVKYEFGKNIIDSDLEFVNEDDVNFKIKAVHVKKNNTKVTKEFGDENGELRTLYFYNLPSGANLETVAKEELKRIKYTGFKGAFNAFLTPIVRAGNVVDIVDSHYAERNGRYLVKKMELSFGTGGARRKIDLGLKIKR